MVGQRGDSKCFLKPEHQRALGGAGLEAKLTDGYRTIGVLSEERLGLTGGAVPCSWRSAGVGRDHSAEPNVEHPDIPSFGSIQGRSGGPTA